MHPNHNFVLHFDIGAPTTKDLILSILVTEWPLSARKIYNEVCKQKPITYHASYKALQDLRSRQIIKKTEQGYLLNLAWVNNLKSFANVAEKYYFKKSKFFKLMKQTDEDTYAMAKQFSTLADLDDFLLDFVEEERESAYSISSHLWFPIFHPKRMIEHANKLALHKKKLNAVSAGRSPMDNYCADYMRSIGGTIALGGQATRNIDFWVFGDKLIHALYPNSLVTRIDGAYKTTDKLDSIATPEFFQQTLYKKTTIPVVIVRSKSMADMLRKSIEGMLGT